MLPTQQVGGDFHDFFLLGEEQLGLVIAGVSGKGVPAAIFMAMTRSILKATALTGVSPAERLGHVNRLLCRESDAGLFVTLFYGILHTRTGEVEYGIAGHAPTYLLRLTGGIAPLEYRGGMVLGVMEKNEYEAGRVGIEPGDRPFLYTDGVSEARDSKEGVFSEQRLEGLFRQTSGSSLPEVISRVLDEVKEFSIGMPQTDDVTVLALRYVGL